jgi:integrase
MAWVEEYETAEGTSFKVCWELPRARVPAGKKKQKEMVVVYDREHADLCKQWAEELKHDVWRADIARRLEDHLRPKTGITFGEWANIVMDMKEGQIRTRTWRNYRSQLDDVILPDLGGKLLGQLTGVEINKFLQKIKKNGTGTDPRHLGEPLTYATCDRYFALIKHILQLAVANGKIPHNPARTSGTWTVGLKDKRTRDDENARHFFAADQYRALLAQIRPDYRLFIRFLCETGARFSEVTNLTVGDLKFDRNTANVRFIEDDEGELQLPKSGYSRPVEVRPSLMRELYVLHADSTPDALVFTTVHGAKIDNSNFRRDHWDPAMIKLRQCSRHLPERVDGRNGLSVYDPHSASACDCLGPMSWTFYTPHALRHTYATWMLMAGRAIMLVSKQLGHSSVKTTEETYAHLEEYWHFSQEAALSSTLDEVLRLDPEGVFAV